MTFQKRVSCSLAWIPTASELVQLKSALNVFSFTSITQAAFFKGIANEWYAYERTMEYEITKWYRVWIFALWDIKSSKGKYLSKFWIKRRKEELWDKSTKEETKQFPNTIELLGLTITQCFQYRTYSSGWPEQWAQCNSLSDPSPYRQLLWGSLWRALVSFVCSLSCHHRAAKVHLWHSPAESPLCLWHKLSSRSWFRCGFNSFQKLRCEKSLSCSLVPTLLSFLQPLPCCSTSPGRPDPYFISVLHSSAQGQKTSSCRPYPIASTTAL